MKKRIACLMLALVLIIGLIPVAAVTASAAATGVSGGEHVPQAPPGRGGYFLCVASLKAHSGNFKAASPPILFLFLGTDRCLQQTQCEQNDREGRILSSV